MAVFSISYDLNKGTKKDYEDLYNAIKSFDNIRATESQWLITTNLSAEQIYLRLKPLFDAQDYMLIVKLAPGYYGWLDKSVWSWLQSRINQF